MVALGLVPSLVITTTGRRSGQPRSNPLLYVPDGDAYVVIGSNWGQQHQPGWALNLLAQPAAEVDVKGRRHRRCAPSWPPAPSGSGCGSCWSPSGPRTGRTCERAGGREIRIFRLVPTGAAPAGPTGLTGRGTPARRTAWLGWWRGRPTPASRPGDERAAAGGRRAPARTEVTRGHRRHELGTDPHLDDPRWRVAERVGAAALRRFPADIARGRGARPARARRRRRRRGRRGRAAAGHLPAGQRAGPGHPAGGRGAGRPDRGRRRRLPAAGPHDHPALAADRRPVRHHPGAARPDRLAARPCATSTWPGWPGPGRPSSAPPPGRRGTGAARRTPGPPGSPSGTRPTRRC